MNAQLIKIYAVMLGVFLAVDLTWIGFIARSFYRRQIGYILADKPVWSAAILFYMLYVLGLMVFVVLPGLESGVCRATMLRAAFFGLVCYATFDLTCLALIKDWPLTVTVVDMLWGMVLSCVVSGSVLLIGIKL